VLLDGPARPAQLAEILLAERSTVSRNLAALQERGWVETTTTSAAGRTMAVTATAEGAAVLTAARDTWAALQATAKEQLGPEATQTLDAWLTASA
jgi:DNA-binding MarR family transcriptional regulator